MSEYVTKQVNLGPLTRCHSAYYKESCVINACTCNIVLVEIDGTKKTIEPTGSSFANQTIVLHKRETMGNSMAFNGGNLSLEGITIEVPYFKLQSGPVFVEEFNIVVCTEEDAETCRHPYAAMKYSESIESSLRMMCDKLCDSPGIRFIANDPTSRYDEIYTLLDTRVVTIPVTHIPDDKFTMTLIVINEGKYYSETVDLTELLSGTSNMIEFNNKFIPFVTTSKLNAETISKTFRWLNPKTFAEFQEREQQKYEAALQIKENQLNALKTERDAKIKELTAKLTIVNTTLAQVQSERDDYKYRYQYLKGDIGATSDMMSSFRDRRKFESDVTISDDDVEISHTKRRHSHEEATFKTWHLILAAAVPTAAAIMLEVFRSK